MIATYFVTCRSPVGRCRRWFVHRHDHGIDRDARPHPLKTVDHDEIAGLQAAAHDAQAVDHGTQLHGPVLNGFVRTNDEHELLVEIGAHRAVLNQQGFRRPVAGDSQSDEEARRQDAVRVAKDRPASDGAAHRIQPVVEKIHLAAPRESLLVGERHLNRQVDVATVRTIRLLRGVLQEDALVGVKVRVNGIERHDRGE